jgi:hypothetical protein
MIRNKTFFVHENNQIDQTEKQKKKKKKKKKKKNNNQEKRRETARNSPFPFFEISTSFCNTAIESRNGLKEEIVRREAKSVTKEKEKKKN